MHREITIVNRYRLELEFATGRTTAAEIEAALKNSVDPKIAYRQQSRESLVRELMSALDKVLILLLDFHSNQTFMASHLQYKTDIVAITL